jgi:hypothetical protein
MKAWTGFNWFRRDCNIRWSLWYYTMKFMNGGEHFKQISEYQHAQPIKLLRGISDNE